MLSVLQKKLRFGFLGLLIILLNQCFYGHPVFGLYPPADEEDDQALFLLAGLGGSNPNTSSSSPTAPGSSTNQTGTYIATLSGSTHLYTSRGDGSWTEITPSGLPGALVEVKKFGSLLIGVTGNNNETPYYSSDGGLSWSAASASTGATNRFETVQVCGTRAMAIQNLNNTQYRAFGSSDGIAWGGLGALVNNTPFRGLLCMDDQNAALFVQNNAYTSSNAGLLWSGSDTTGLSNYTLDTPFGAAFNTGASVTALIYAASGDVYAQHSTTKGASFDAAESVLASSGNPSFSGGMVHTANGFFAVMHLSGSPHYARVFKSPDGLRSNWSTVTDVDFGSVNFPILKYGTANGNTILFSGQDNAGNAIAIQSDDGGATWTRVTSLPGTTAITSITFAAD
ncbi:MAG: exo-alpha-sialidase [Leptospiraceae bacterium]|nr:exo-alpha-sialidase [Leptospiraceae bacterium]